VTIRGSRKPRGRDAVFARLSRYVKLYVANGHWAAAEDMLDAGALALNFGRADTGAYFGQGVALLEYGV
jgi:hypothetical protein